MGTRAVRALLATLLAAAPFVVLGGAPAVADVPGGSSGGGCGTVKYNRVGGGVAVRSLCSVPGGSAFHGGGGGGGSDPGCRFRRPKKDEDGHPIVDPDNPMVFIMEDAFGIWDYFEMSDINVVPFDEDPPAGTDFMDWVHSFPTFQDNAGGDRVFGVFCIDPEALNTSYLLPSITVPPTDPFWENLPAQLEQLTARLDLRKPTLAFTPGGPDIWNGFLTNAPYGVSMGNDIWNSVRANDVDRLGAWHLSVVASPVSAAVIVKRGHDVDTLNCAIGPDGPKKAVHLPRFDPPAQPLQNLPPCTFTARWAQGANISVSMRITYHVVGFIDNAVQIQRDEDVTSAVQTWPVVRAEAVNTQGN
jgi:hypothetical protein